MRGDKRHMAMNAITSFVPLVVIYVLCGMVWVPHAGVAAISQIKGFRPAIELI